MQFKDKYQHFLKRLLLLAGDALSVVVALAGAAYVRLTPADVQWSGYMKDHMVPFIGVFIVYLLVFYASGMYERETLTRKSRSTIVPLIATLVATFLSMGLFYAWFSVDIGRGIMAIASGFIFLETICLRYLYRVAVGYGFLSRRTLIVGNGEEVDRVLRLMKSTDDSGRKVFGIISVGELRPGTFKQGIPILGHMQDLRRFVDAYEVETIIVAMSRHAEPGILQELRPLRYLGVQCMDHVSLHEELVGEIPLDHINDEWLMNAAMNSSVIHIRKIKRMMDILLSLTGLIVLFPLAVLAAILIKVSSRGPVLYRQRRVQLGGQLYTLLKYRTMCQDAEAKTGAVWADKSDDRVTRVGRALRATRMDEIPQLINVLKGEMSLVGPRPERPEFIDELARKIPFYRERLLVLPGITGWAQVKYPYAASAEAARKKLQYDLYYIKHMSFLLDCQIMLRTVKIIFSGTWHSGDNEMQDEDRTGGEGGLTVLPSGDNPEAGQSVG